VEIIFHAHNAPIPDRLRRRAELALHQTARRFPQAVDAIVRFEQDGPVRRVEIVLHAPRQRKVIALGEGKFYGPALTAAIEKLGAQVRKLRRAHKPSVRKRAATQARKSGTLKRVATRAVKA
jgi:ribosome-associated translation inhibitor RaiA